MLQNHCAVVSCDEAGSTDEFELISDQSWENLNLTRRLNNCEAASPRYDVELKDLEQLQNNLLPSPLFGFIILTTSTNIMNQQNENTQEEKFWASFSGDTCTIHINKMSQWRVLKWGQTKYIKYIIAMN